MLGAVVRIQLNRDYGPYLDERPMLMAGEYQASLFGISPSSGKHGIYLVEMNGHEYAIEAKDTTLI